MNTVTLIGRVGQNPELRYTTGGTPVSEISIAVDSGSDEAHWIPVVAWGRTAEVLAEHVAKGRQVAVEGELRVHEWQPDQGPKRRDLKVHARRIDFLARPRTSNDQAASPT